VEEGKKARRKSTATKAGSKYIKNTPLSPDRARRFHLNQNKEDLKGTAELSSEDAAKGWAGKGGNLFSQKLA